MNALHFNLHAAGVLAPGIDSLADLRAVCRRGCAPDTTAPLTLPSPVRLAANERRRASQVVRLTLACIEQAMQHSPFAADTLRSVFATDEGTGEVCQQMLEALATTRQVSPLIFPNSVQNAPSGYYSIAWRNAQPATVISLGLESFASGLLCAVTEANTTGAPVLLVAYDPAMTAPLNELLPISAPTATAWILSAHTDPPALARFTLELDAQHCDSPTPLPPWIGADWTAQSSAYALASLGLLEAEVNTVMRLTLGRQHLLLRCVDRTATEDKP